jgi:hypothetical protein
MRRRSSGRHGPRPSDGDEALPPAALAPRLDASAVVVGDAVAAYPELAAGGARALSFATHHPHGGIVARLGAAILAAAVGPTWAPSSPPTCGRRRPSWPGARDAGDSR